jgi:dCMP deaminase
MTERINRDQKFMMQAGIEAMRSTCCRLHVGAIIAFDDRPIASGYNGAPSGMEHCNDDNCTSQPQCDRTVHAEMNAILFAAKYGVPIEGATLYTTHQPCLNCAKAIINSGIDRVVYEFPYRKREGLDLLEKARVEVVQLI